MDRVALGAALTGAAYYVAAFLYVALSRISYPFALEWLEGGSYLQVQRVLSGQALYAQPTMAYVAMIYPPLFYYVAAALARMAGFGFFTMRLVSLLSSLGCIVLIYLICRGEGTNWQSAALGSGLFAATYSLSGFWFDIARVDMLSVFLVLAAIWLLRLKTRAAAVAAGLVFAMACLTKQTHLITFACVSAYMISFERRRLLWFSLSTVALLAAAYLFLDHLYSGWFRFFVLRLALGSGEYVTFAPATFLQTALDFWSGSILFILPVVSILILAFIVIEMRRGGDRPRLFFFLACAVGMIGTSWSVVQVGGFKNDLVPAYAVLAILFGLSLQWLLFTGSIRMTIRAGLITLCALQFVFLGYPLAAQIPTPGDLEAGQQLVSRLRSQPGEVYVPFHPDLALMANKAPYASWSPMFQLEGNYGGGDIRQSGRVKTEFSRAMADHRFSMIVLDQQPNWIWGNPQQHYSISSAPVFADPAVFWPVTGWQTRPEIIMLPAAQ